MVQYKNCISEVHFAPLQGYTDMAYYSACSMFFPHVDFYYTPYYSVDDRLTQKIGNIPDRIINQLIPQVLPRDLNELKLLMAFIVENGFSEINLNLGCPYPMVTKRGRGAALIGSGDEIADMIDYINDNSSLRVSIKTRIGMEDELEIFGLLEKIAMKEIKSVIVHPRTAKQLYKGSVSLPIYQQCRILFPDVDFIYNGDIIDLETFEEIQEILAGQQKWMIGRGLLSNPFFSGQIKGFEFNNEAEKRAILYGFAKKLSDEIERDSNDRGHFINRLKTQFYYLSNAFPNPQKVIRKIKKIKSKIDLEEILINALEN